MSKNKGQWFDSQGKEKPGRKQTVALAMSTLEKNMSSMFARYQRYYQMQKKNRIPFMKSYLDIYFKWMDFHCQYEDVEKFTGHSQNFMPKNPQDSKSDYQFFNSVEPYSDIEFEWNFRFSEKLSRRLKSSSPTLKNNVVSTAFGVAKGIFDSVKLFKSGPISYMATFYTSIDKSNILVFCVLPERTPELRKGTVYSYSYTQYINFIDIVNHVNRIDKLLEKFIKKIVDHPDKFGCFENNEAEMLANVKSELKKEDANLSKVVKIESDNSKIYV